MNQEIIDLGNIINEALAHELNEKDENNATRWRLLYGWHGKLLGVRRRMLADGWKERGRIMCDIHYHYFKSKQGDNFCSQCGRSYKGIFQEMEKYKKEASKKIAKMRKMHKWKNSDATTPRQPWAWQSQKLIMECMPLTASVSGSQQQSSGAAISRPAPKQNGIWWLESSAPEGSAHEPDHGAAAGLSLVSLGNNQVVRNTWHLQVSGRRGGASRWYQRT